MHPDVSCTRCIRSPDCVYGMNPDRVPLNYGESQNLPVITAVP